MIVHEGEFNAMDQRLLEYALLEKHGLETVRLTLKQINDEGTLSKGGALEIALPTGRKVEIAVAYYRTGYAPRDYPTQANWDARLLVERSMALKCPNAAWHLAGTKKMQQVGRGEGARTAPRRGHTLATDCSVLFCFCSCPPWSPPHRSCRPPIRSSASYPMPRM